MQYFHYSEESRQLRQEQANFISTFINPAFLQSSSAQCKILHTEDFCYDLGFEQSLDLNDLDHFRQPSSAQPGSSTEESTHFAQSIPTSDRKTPFHQQGLIQSEHLSNQFFTIDHYASNTPQVGKQTCTLANQGSRCFRGNDKESRCIQSLTSLRGGKDRTKNITKNMGKLLLKWIWTHRQSLQARLSVEKSVWEDFIIKVKEWKAQNNITRMFLRLKWHGTTPQSQLFRILSAHFFRCQCLAAITQSNIENKALHLIKRSKFLAGTQYPTAMDTLS